MASEKFFVFNESGTLKRLKGRIVRFLDNEEPDNDDKVAIRSSLSVPASAEGLTPANNLSDVSNAATSRTNLEVNSIAQDAEATGIKLVGPSLRFDGSNDYIEFSDNDAFTFSNGTDDLPFSGACWAKFDSAASTFIFTKWGTSSANREYALYVSATNDIRLELSDTSGNAAYRDSDTVLSGYNGQWVHLAWTYGGSGPNSTSAFAAAANEMTLYVNGAAVSSTAVNNASYGGMSNTGQAVWTGRYSSSYGQAEIKDVKLYNKELSAAEVKTLCLSGSLPESVGAVLDARAEQFDTSTGKLYDLSGNGFVGTNNGATLLGREFPVYETGTWSGVYSPTTGSFATMTMDTSLVYTRIGNLVTVTGFLQTDNVDITGGSGQLQITGLPFAASVVSTCHIGFAYSWGSATPLTGAVIGSTIRLYTRASTTGNTDTFDVSNLSAGALANRNTIYISATYQIS